MHLFNPLGIMRAASTINQYRVHAGYHYPSIGSRFTTHVVEDNPERGRRILHVPEDAPGEIHMKVVSAVKAARLVCERIAGNG